MTVIKASCPTCGECELGPADIDLQTYDDATYGQPSYAFLCPNCRYTVRKPADERIVSLLLSGGVRPREIRVPDEVREVHIGPPLNYDDLLDLCLALDATDYLVED